MTHFSVWAPSCDG